jgi:hypothetical protein
VADGDGLRAAPWFASKEQTLPKKEDYKTIDEQAGRLILEAAHRYPTLGRKRLWALLLEDGVNVDPLELKHFLREHGIGGAQPGPAPRRAGANPLTGLMPRFPSFGGGREKGRKER